jgi:hypothetical protein
MDEKKLSIEDVYGAIVAHRFLVQYLLTVHALETVDPIAKIREVIDTTIVSMTRLKVGALAPLIEKAAAELELIGQNLELRLSDPPK